MIVARPIWTGCLTLMMAVLPAAAQTVRVASCDLGPVTAPAKPSALDEAAQQLKQFAPDVILIRRATGWKMCSQLAEALKPAEYCVVACSVFRNSEDNGLSSRQVGILARKPAYFSWCEPWSFSAAGGGFLFAAVQVSGHRFGFSCIDLEGSQSGLEEQAMGQWLKTLQTYRSWSNNRLEGFVTASSGINAESGETGRVLGEMGFASLPGGKKAGYNLAHLVPDAGSPGGLVLTKWPMQCEFDFHPPPVVVVAAAPGGAAAGPEPETQTSFLKKPAVAWWFAAAVTGVLGVILILQLGIRRRLARLQNQAGLLSAGTGSYNVVLAPPALPTPGVEQIPTPNVAADRERLRQGLFAHLTEWVKQAVIQRLVRDREKLMVTQQEAAVKLLAVDDRLARLELKIQKETASYEKQIEQLSRELLTAREENLELIRAQINLLKSEMESARARVLESEEP